MQQRNRGSSASLSLRSPSPVHLSVNLPQINSLRSAVLQIRLTTMTIPKWIGWIPTASTIGSRIGVRIRIAGVVSITIPTISKNTLSTRSKTILFVKCARIHALISCGTCISVSTLENAMDAARIKRIGAYVLIASTIMVQISLILILL